MSDRRTQLLFRAVPGTQRQGSGHGYIINGSNGWTVTGVIRFNNAAKNLTAKAGWGPTEDFKALTVPLNRVDTGGVWNLSGRGIGPAPGVIWITLDEKLVLSAGAVSSQSWRQQATDHIFPGIKKTVSKEKTAPSQPDAKTAAVPAVSIDKGQSVNQSLAISENPDRKNDDYNKEIPEESEVYRDEREGVHIIEGPPLVRRQEATALSQAAAETSSADSQAVDDAAASAPPLPSAAAPDTIEELMEKYPEETPFIGLLPGAKFVRVPVPGDSESYDHYIVGHIPIGQKGFYLVGVPGPAGWQAPAGLPQFMHYLPGRLGGGYWVRYMVPDGSWK